MDTTRKDLDVSNLDLWELSKMFLDTIENPNTSRRYRRVLIDFIGLQVESGNILPSGDCLNADALRAFLASKEPQAESTRVNVIKIIRRFSSWLSKEFHTQDKLKSFKVPRDHTKFKHPVSDEARAVLYSLAMKRFSSYRDSRLSVAILFCLCLGLRPEVSALAIRWQDVDLDEGRIDGIPVKGGSYQTRALTNEWCKVLAWHKKLSAKYIGCSLDALAPYPVLASRWCASDNAPESCSWHSSGLRRHFNSLSQLLGETITARSLRHTFAHTYLDNGGDPYRLAHELAHTDVNTAMHYTFQRLEQQRDTAKETWDNVRRKG